MNIDMLQECVLPYSSGFNEKKKITFVKYKGLLRRCQ